MYQREICTYDGKSNGYYCLKLVHNSAREKIVRERKCFSAVLALRYLLPSFLRLLYDSSKRIHSKSIRERERTFAR